MLSEYFNAVQIFHGIEAIVPFKNFSCILSTVHHLHIFLFDFSFFALCLPTRLYIKMSQKVQQAKAKLEELKHRPKDTQAEQLYINMLHTLVNESKADDNRFARSLIRKTLRRIQFRDDDRVATIGLNMSIMMSQIMLNEFDFDHSVWEWYAVDMIPFHNVFKGMVGLD